MINKTVATWILLSAWVLSAGAAYEPDSAIRSNNQAVVDCSYAGNVKKFKDNPDMLVKPGLLADRKTRRVKMMVEATGMAEGSPIEFFLIGSASGHGYESLAISFSKPGDVQKALEFIGMKPGRPADIANCQFWPKGERVNVWFSPPANRVPSERLRMEDLVLDSRTKKPLPACGFVFTGAEMIESTEKPGLKAYCVDVREPCSIASTYNAPETVLDVPFAWSQKTVYGDILVNPAHVLKAGALLEVTFEPQNMDGSKRVMDLSLEISGVKGSPAASLADLEFRVTDSSGVALTSKPALNAALALFSSLNEKGRDPFVTVRFSDDVTIGAAHGVAQLLSKIDSDNGIRVEAPPPGQLFYRAFIPNEQNRTRSERISQPWELALSVSNSVVAAVLTKVDQIWKDDSIQPALKATEFAIRSPDELKKTLKDAGPGIPVIFVFADPLITVGALMRYMAPVRSDYPMIHVYVR